MNYQSNKNYHFFKIQLNHNRKVNVYNVFINIFKIFLLAIILLL